MPDLLADLPLSKVVKETLLGVPTPFQDILKLATAFEVCNWGQIGKIANS